MKHPLKCSKIQNLLSAYLDGDLTPEQNCEVQAHLELCSQCQEALDELDLVASASKDLAAAHLETDLWPAIQRRVLTPVAPAAARRLRPSILGGWRPRIAWAAALASVLVAVFVLRNDFGPQPPQGPVTPPRASVTPDRGTDIELARQYYERSAEALQNIVIHRSRDLDLDRVLLYRDKLDQLEDVISECSLALEKNKYDVRAQQALFNAYDQKISTLREMALVSGH
jgi:hypothetical protein